MTGKLASRFTIVLSAISLMAAAAVALITASNLLSDRAATALSDFGGVFFIGLAAVAVLRTASMMGQAGRPWTLIGTGIAVYWAGDVVWTFVEVIQGKEVPYPGLPDLLYLSAYAFFALGMLTAGLAYRGLIPLKMPVIGATTIGTVLSMVLYASVLRPYILVDGVTGLEKFVSSAYPLGDVLFMFAPAMFIALVIVSLGGGRFGAPWRAVALGTIVFACADVAYVIIESVRGYETNALVEFGWSAGFLMIMTGALLARDLTRPLDDGADESNG